MAESVSASPRLPSRPLNCVTFPSFFFFIIIHAANSRHKLPSQISHHRSFISLISLHSWGRHCLELSPSVSDVPINSSCFPNLALSVPPSANLTYFLHCLIFFPKCPLTDSQILYQSRFSRETEPIGDRQIDRQVDRQIDR